MRPLVISCDTEEGVRRRARINFEHDVLSATLPETLPAEWLARYGSSVYGAGERTRLAIMACFHSHLRVWQRVVGSESGVLVVEDDALWLPSAAPLPEAFPGFTYVAAKLNHPTTFVKNDSRELRATARALSPGLQPVDDARYSLSGTCAYYVDPSTARWLLEQAARLRMMRPVDGWLRKLMRLHARPRWLLAPSPFVCCSFSSISRGQFRYLENYVLRSNRRTAQRALESHGLMTKEDFERHFLSQVKSSPSSLRFFRECGQAPRMPPRARFVFFESAARRRGAAPSSPEQPRAAPSSPRTAPNSPEQPRTAPNKPPSSPEQPQERLV